MFDPPTHSRDVRIRLERRKRPHGDEQTHRLEARIVGCKLPRLRERAPTARLVAVDLGESVRHPPEARSPRKLLEYSVQLLSGSCPLRCRQGGKISTRSEEHTSDLQS